MRDLRSIVKMLTPFAVAGVLLLGAASLEAAGRGSGKSGGQGRPPAGQPGAGQPGAGAGQGSATGERLRSHDRIHLNDAQRDRVRALSASADKVERQARGMAQEMRQTFEPSEMRRQHQQLSDQVHTMLRQHDQLMAGLQDADRARLHDRTHKLDRARQRMESCLSNMERQLAGPSPDPQQVRQETRQLARATRAWENQQRKLASDLAVGA